ncbi:chondroitinase-B domain-containing protein [Rubrivirga sp. IMCC45206]|uniref:chondroitinase-B domain-containing protein n=1 Tax=Rubrivirga sp. IMCC45206 TaxID=3391614 RepID=UPI00398FC551
MMRSLTLLAALTVAAAFSTVAAQTAVHVATSAELDAAIAAAEPGTEIVMADGEWSDVRIRFVGTGTAEAPITLRAETPGGVVVRGASDLWLAGEHLVVDGLHFRDGATPSGAVIRFFVSDDSLATHSRVTNCAIVGYNQPQRSETDLWVQFKGRHNQLDHCYLAGKSNRGPTVRVDLDGNPSIYNYHRIAHNHFGPRPPKGGPSAETIQIGDSGTSMTPSHTLVENNLFDRCDGEVEVISSKANFNAFRGNVFYRSEGSLVTRHGNYAVVDGNVFIGDGANPYYGGIRLIGTGHWVTNNHFVGLRGQEFRAPLAMMNGIPRSSINRYFQVTDVVVAHNTWVDSGSPWQIGVGSNTDQAEVLPPSEIRSLPPTRTVLANNVIYNPDGGPSPIVRYDAIDGIDFRRNVIDNGGVPFEGVEGLMERDLSFAEVAEHIGVPISGLDGVAVHHGFEFDRIDHDLFGQPRAEHNAVGATNGTVPEAVDLLDLSRYGPSWYAPETDRREPRTHPVADAAALAAAVAAAADGDVIALAPGTYEIGSSLAIDRELTVRAADPTNRPTIRYVGGAGTAAFAMHPGGHLRLASVALEGDAETIAVAPLASGMSSLYTVEVEDAEISGFDAVLRATKHSFADLVRFERTVVRDVANGLELAAEDDDRGDYNAEAVVVLDSRFEGVGANVIDYYRGGYDESTVGGTLVVRGTTVTGSGANDPDDVLIDTYGIINVELADNTFRDNAVERVALLWGAKNNTHADNTVEASGEIVVEQNLPQRLVY